MNGCAIYILRVPEFAPIVGALRALAGVTVTERGDYDVAAAPDEIALQRGATGVGPAVWFGALTGGIIGRIAEYSAETLRITPA